VPDSVQECRRKLELCRAFKPRNLLIEGAKDARCPLINKKSLKKNYAGVRMISTEQ
jgi:hypothetical protein